MARSRMKNYKQVDTFTKDMGSAGNQVLLGKIQKIDNVGATGYVNNVTISAIVNDAPGDETYGIMYYASTAASWADDDVITARACAVAGTKSLSLKRRVASGSAQTDRNDGTIYIYGELTDVTVTDNVTVRFVVETWGRYVEWV